MHARALVEGVRAYDPQLPILGLPGSVVLEIAAAAGNPVVAEGFPDRAYTAQGRLVPRRAADSVLADPQEVAHRAVRMALHGEVIAQTGEVVDLGTRSLCLHGDTPGAVTLARRTRDALRAAGAVLAAFT